MFNCSEVDGRNVFWEGDPWELVTKKCDEGSFTDETFSNGKQYYIHYTTSTCLNVEKTWNKIQVCSII